eukprot:TRINITY_DN53_c1_g2_i1.p1 TRINITY_DN53_c1_g2~~TRINITY_DN53_c1_g2_i1.p1  ORF type:complete len:2070 (+),score=437.91 TRINITY_DN53_c1_g2_i1:62-6271(+)
MFSRLAAVTLLAASAAAQYAGVSVAQFGQPRIPLAAEACPNLISLVANPVTVDSSSRVRVLAEAWCGSTPLGGLAASQCGVAQNWQLLDDGEPVTTLEAQMTVSVAPGTVQTLILIDLSKSIQDTTPLTFVQQGVHNFLDKAAAATASTGQHDFAIYTFDGRAAWQKVHGWSNDINSLKNAVNSIACGQPSLPLPGQSTGALYCDGSSTNLYGAIVTAVGEIRDRVGSINTNIRTTARGTDSALVIFTDGEDEAARESGSNARQALQDAGILAVTVGVVNVESEADSIRQLALITGDANAAYIAYTFPDVPARYSTAADVVLAYFSRSYLIEYCSPRRRYLHYLDLRAISTTGVMGPKMEYIAGNSVIWTGHNNNANTITGTVRSVTVQPNLANVNYYSVEYQDPSTNTPTTIIDQTTGSLELYYDTASFVYPPSCMVPINEISPCSVSGGALAPYQCTGGSLFQCTAGSGSCTCADTFGGVDSNCGTVCGGSDQEYLPGLYIDRPCAGGLMQNAPTNFTQGINSFLSMTFTAQCADGTPVGGLTFSPCDTLSSIQVMESDINGQFSSTYEARHRITCIAKPAHIVSLILVDMSNSIHRGRGVSQYQSYVSAYLDGMSSDVSSHVAAIYAFDGSQDIVRISDFNSPTAAKSTVTNLNCATNPTLCRDPSTNLNGAIVQGSALLRQYITGNPTASDGTYRQPFLVLVTDGTDQSRFETDAAAQAAIVSNGVGVFGIGIKGERRDGGRGVDLTRLQNLATSGVYISQNANMIQESFGRVSSAITTAAASSYRLDYCTAKRSGTHTLRVQLTHHNSVVLWDHQFDASAFDCRNDACQQCLGGPVTTEFSCAAQPPPENQIFQCAGQVAPVAVDGYCRCPCGSQAEYPQPASSLPGPGPIVCETPGSCAAGDRITCSGHGGLGPGGDFDKFGVATNSRISMEFSPQCADNWPIPSLRMSVCDSLTDFRVYETNVDGVEETVNVFESEPRVICFPDVVTLILLDTSGSINMNGLDIVKASVISYIEELENKLTVQHMIAVYAFDGRRNTETLQVVMDFTTDTAALKARVLQWSCAEANFCRDFSTNLNGAVIAAEEVLRAEAGAFAWRQQAYLVLFSDGTDQASVFSDQDAVNRMNEARTSYGLTVYAVALTGEDSGGNVGVFTSHLTALSAGPPFVATSFDQIGFQFSQVASAVVAATTSNQNAFYRIDYCSPKRAGISTVIVELRYDGGVVRWSNTFDASQFQCAGGACARCLTNKKVYSCVDQPAYGPGGGDQQFFRCDTGANPLNVNGFCKCPCSGTYPPEKTQAPIVTQVPQSGLGPSISPFGGAFASPTSVTISAPTGAAIYYTTDGTLPSAASFAYTGPFTVGVGETTVRAVYVLNTVVSDVSTATFIISSTTQPPTSCQSFTVTGFSSMAVLNGAYNVDTTRPISNEQTYWKSTADYFFYYCSTSQRWEIAAAQSYSVVAAGTCNPVASSNVQQSMMQPSWSEGQNAVTIGFSCSGTGTTNAVPTGNTAQSTLSLGLASGTRTFQNVFTNLSPGAGEAATQTLSSSCSASPSNVVQAAPSSSVSGTLSLSVTPLSAGTAVITCVFTDNGNPVRSISLQTTALVTSGVTPPTPFTPNPITNTNFFGIKMVVRTPLATMSETGFETGALSMLQSGGIGASAAFINYICPLAACPNIANCPATAALRASAGCREGGSNTERLAELLQTTINDNVVDFGFTTSNAVGTTAKYNELVQANSLFNQQLACTTCALAQYSPQSSQLSSYNPTTTVPPPVTQSTYGHRMILRYLLSLFNKDSFASAVLQTLLNGGQNDVTGVIVQWACPASACGNNANNCPTTAATRSTAGCQNFVAGRGVEVLQTTNAGTDTIVDFQTAKLGSTNPLTSQSETDRILQQQLSCVNTGASCPLNTYNPQSVSSYQPITPTANPFFVPITPTPTNDDDGLEDWEIALIVIGCLLGLCCICVLVWYFCFRKKKDKNREKEMNYPPPHPMQSRGSASSYDEYYTTDYPSYSYATEVFEPHDRVRALYIDGQWYDGEIAGQSPDGTYEIKWADGQHSEGIPGHQIQRL